MSNLSHIRTALRNNTEAVVLGPFEEANQTEKNQNWDKTLSFYVAPKKGLYAAKDLQIFMLSLVPQMEPTAQSDFDKTNNHPFSGNVCFDENIGTKTVHCEAEFTRKDLSEDDEFVSIPYQNQKSCSHETVWLHIWVWVFPDLEMASDACRGKKDFKQTHYAETYPSHLLQQFF